MNCALINTITNKVESLIYVLDVSWNPGNNLMLVPLTERESCFIGQVYDESNTPRFYGDPTPVPRVYTSYEFILRFTAAERLAYRTASTTDQNIADFMELVHAAHEIQTDHPMTIAGMDYLVSVGILTQQRRDEILS